MLNCWKSHALAHVYNIFIFQSLFSTTALGLGGKYFLIYELMGVGCHWDNIMVSPKEHDGFSLFLVFLMMIIDSGVYFVLAWYIEHVHPGMNNNYLISLEIYNMDYILARNGHIFNLLAFVNEIWYRVFKFFMLSLNEH